MQIHLIMLSEEGSTYVALEAKETSQCFKCTYNGEVIQLRKVDEYKFSAGRGFCTAIMYGRDLTELLNGFRNAVVISNLTVAENSEPQAADDVEPHSPETEASVSPEVAESDSVVNTEIDAAKGIEAAEDDPDSADMPVEGSAQDADAKDITPDTTATSCNSAISVLVNVMLPFQREESEEDSNAAVAQGNEAICGFCGGVFDSFLAEIETLPDGNIAAKCP